MTDSTKRRKSHSSVKIFDNDVISATKLLGTALQCKTLVESAKYKRPKLQFGVKVKASFLAACVCAFLGSSAHAEPELKTDRATVRIYEIAIRNAMAVSKLRCPTEAGGDARKEVEKLFLKELDSVFVDNSGSQPALVLSRTIGEQLYVTRLLTSPDYNLIVAISAQLSSKQPVNRGTLVAPKIVLEYVPESLFICN
jgi:hypothetical protein